MTNDKDKRQEALDIALAQIERNFGKKSILNRNKTNMIKFEHDVHAILQDLGNVLISKQNDYGPYNISRAPGGALNGLRVRIYDKVSRINNLIDTGATPENESLRDSFLDLANYGVIALMVLDGNWPTLEREIK